MLDLARLSSDRKYVACADCNRKTDIGSNLCCAAAFCMSLYRSATTRMGYPTDMSSVVKTTRELEGAKIHVDDGTASVMELVHLHHRDT
jgi:hypothetical protein